MVLYNLPLYRLREVYRPRYGGNVATYRRFVYSISNNILYGFLAQSQCRLSCYRDIFVATTRQVCPHGRRLDTSELRLYEILCRGLWIVGYAIKNIHYGSMCRI